VAALESLKGDPGTHILNDPEGPWIVAGYFSLLGEKETALNLLEKAVEIGWCNFPLFSEIDPLLEGVRGESRFDGLMKRVKPEWEAFGLE
jgi:hypothetical protein